MTHTPTRPQLLPGEEDAIRAVQSLGKKYGYGNLISRLKEAWREDLIGFGLGEPAADYGSQTVCAWCDVDSRTGNKYHDSGGN